MPQWLSTGLRKLPNPRHTKIKQRYNKMIYHIAPSAVISLPFFTKPHKNLGLILTYSHSGKENEKNSSCPLVASSWGNYIEYLPQLWAYHELTGQLPNFGGLLSFQGSTAASNKIWIMNSDLAPFLVRKKKEFKES